MPGVLGEGLIGRQPLLATVGAVQSVPSEVRSRYRTGACDLAYMQLFLPAGRLWHSTLTLLLQHTKGMFGTVNSA